MHFFALAKHRISRYSVDLSHNLLEADDAVRRGEGGKGGHPLSSPESQSR